MVESMGWQGKCIREVGAAPSLKSCLTKTFDNMTNAPKVSSLIKYLERVKNIQKSIALIMLHLWLVFIEGMLTRDGL